MERHGVRNLLKDKVQTAVILENLLTICKIQMDDYQCLTVIIKLFASDSQPFVGFFMKSCMKKKLFPVGWNIICEVYKNLKK